MEGRGRGDSNRKSNVWSDSLGRMERWLTGQEPALPFWRTWVQFSGPLLDSRHLYLRFQGTWCLLQPFPGTGTCVCTHTQKPTCMHMSKSRSTKDLSNTTHTNTFNLIFLKNCCLIKNWTKDWKRNFFKDNTKIANRHMKGCSTFEAIREMWIQTISHPPGWLE